MIGAMPAVAVRHERRKQDKKKSRPGHLYLANYANKQATSSSRTNSPCPSRGGSPSPGSAGGTATSPIVTTPLHGIDSPQTEEFYVCARVSTLHVIVVSFLLGIILLIVGLVQLKPGADASDHRFYILGAGSMLLGLGTLLSVARCLMTPIRRCLYKRRARLRRLRKEESAALSLTKAAAQNGSSSSTPAQPHHHHHQTQHRTSHDIIQEVPSAEERAASDALTAATGRNGATLTQSQSVSIEIEAHSSKDTLVSTVKSPSENDAGLHHLHKRPSLAKT